MTTPALIALLAERHRDRFGQLQRNAVDLSTRAWDSLSDWTSPAAADAWADLWLPITDSAVEAAAVSTDAYFALAVDGEALGVGGLTAAGLRGVPAEEYARRPLVTLYTQLSKGVSFDDAKAVSRSRLGSMVATDVSLGQRRAADEWSLSGRVVGYRRTLTGKSCVLCAMASTQRYHAKKLMPIHGRCDCGVAPIVGDEDPGQVINQELLDKLHETGAAGRLTLEQGAYRFKKRAGANRARAENARQEAQLEDDPGRRKRLEKRAKNYAARAEGQDARAAEYRAALKGEAKYAVHQHGELGPIITRDNVAFLSEADLN